MGNQWTIQIQRKRRTQDTERRQTKQNKNTTQHKLQL